MINIYEVTETNQMIAEENLDVRTITLGISLMDCIDSDLQKLNEKIYNKFLQWKKEPLKPEFMKKIEAQRVHPFIRLCHLLHLPPPTSRYYGARKKNAHRS